MLVTNKYGGSGGTRMIYFRNWGTPVNLLGLPAPPYKYVWVFMYYLGDPTWIAGGPT